jgi:hypothetical protein
MKMGEEAKKDSMQGNVLPFTPRGQSSVPSTTEQDPAKDREVVDNDDDPGPTAA